MEIASAFICIMATQRSIVEYFAEHEGYRCGYCHSTNTSFSHGMWAHTMTVQDYQDLIDRGWRRSGKYCYKPTLNRTCCPQNTIRCAALDIKLSKSQKKIIKQVNRYLIHGIKRERNEERESEDNPSSSGEDLHHHPSKKPSSDVQVKTTVSTKPGSPHTPQQKIPSLPAETPTEQKEAKQPTLVSDTSTVTDTDQKSKHKPTPGKGADPKLPPCKKAKQIRAEKKKEKLLKSGQEIVIKQKGPTEKSLEDFLNEPEKAENPAHKLEIKLMRSSPPSTEFFQSFQESHQVYHKYQTKVHKDPPEKPSEKQYKRFLCDSPLTHVKGNLPMGYGSFHQHYILDGKLIAVAVLDILPYSVSSVYLYYDPDYSFLSLGTYSALRELAFVRDLNKSAPLLKYYYMGFYIHSCSKMRYKGQYHPSFLVCPETYAWVPLEKCVPKLDVAKYSRLDDNNTEDNDREIDVNRVLVLHNGEASSYEVHILEHPEVKDEAEVREYASFVGKTCAERMLLYRK